MTPVRGRRANGVNVDLALAGDERHEARRRTALDVSLKDVVKASQSRLGEWCRASHESK